MSTVTLFYFEYCANNGGRWDREWAASRAAINRLRTKQLRWFGSSARDGEKGIEMIGEYGDVDTVCIVQVEQSPKGILQFAQGWGGA